MTHPNLTEIVIPVYNEERVIAGSVHRLRADLRARFPFPWVITIADNGSTDATFTIAEELAAALPDVRALRVPVKGRGGALRYAWARSEATVVSYMDVDLSIDLDAFAPLVASVMSGHSALAIGTRYAQGSYVDRSLTRAFLSRSYNQLLHTVLGARFSDAMCGFKAARRDVVAPLLAEIRDDRWFFDTELLLLAQRRGLRIHEVPVVCIDDPDSSVHIVRDSCDDLRAMARVAPRLRGGLPSARYSALRAAGAVGHLLLFAALAGSVPPTAANALALAAAVAANAVALRAVSFGVRGAAGVLHHQLRLWVDAGLRAALTTLGLLALPSGGVAVVAAGTAAAAAVAHLVMRGGPTATAIGADGGADPAALPASTPLTLRAAA